MEGTDQSKQKVSSYSVPKLTVDSVAALFPANCYHFVLDEHDVGTTLQKKQTYILADLQESFPLLTRPRCKKILTLKEVLQDGSAGKKFSLFTYDDMARKLHKSVDHLQNIWLALEGGSLTKRYATPGMACDKWCTFTMSMNNQIVPDASVSVITGYAQVIDKLCMAQDVSDQTQDRNTNVCGDNRAVIYTSINEAKIGQKVSMFGVVREVVKPATLCSTGSYQIQLSLVDPSCLAPDAERTDMLFFIFFNNKMMTDLPGGVGVGDILRTTHNQMHTWNNARLRGKVWSAFQVVKFSSNPEDPVHPVTENTNYVLSQMDCKHVLNLRKWWQDNRGLVDNLDPVQLWYVTSNPTSPGSPENPHQKPTNWLQRYPDIGAMAADSLMRPLRIRELERQVTFDLQCLILEVRPIVLPIGINVVVLRVTDGTKSQLCFEELTFENATEELMANNHKLTVCAKGSKNVCVIVYEGTGQIEKAKNLEKGTFVTLCQVECHPMVEGELKEHSDCFSLSMKQSTCNLLTTEDNKWIIQTLNGKNQLEGTADSNDSELMLARKYVDKNVSGLVFPESSVENSAFDSVSQHKSRIVSGDPDLNPKLDSGALRSPTVQGSKCSLLSQIESVNNSPHLPSHTDSMDQILQDISIPSDVCRKRNESNFSNSQDVLITTTPSDNFTNQKSRRGSEVILHSEDIVAGTSGLNTKTRVNDEALISSQRKQNQQTIKRSSVSICKFPSKRKTLKRRVYTECTVKNREMQLKEFKQSAAAGEVYCIHAYVKELHIQATEPCTTCQGELCFHDWVVALCLHCSSHLDSSQLRRMFTPREIVDADNGIPLLCPNCAKERHMDDCANSVHRETRSWTRRSSGSPSKYINTEMAVATQTQTRTKGAQSLTDGNWSVANVQGSDHIDNIGMVAVVRLNLTLVDKARQILLTTVLGGDQAKEFFGVNPMFRWAFNLTKQEENCLLPIRDLIYSHVPLEWGLQKITMNKCTDISYVVANTKLKVAAVDY